MCENISNEINLLTLFRVKKAFKINFGETTFPIKRGGGIEEKEHNFFLT